jgi:S1-C subfamily serine protease
MTETFVRKVIEGGAAAALGLRVGDVFVRYDGQAITHSGNFILRRDAQPAAGPKRELEVRREGQTLRFAIQPGKLQVILSDRALGWTGPTAGTPPSTAPASAPVSAPAASGR